MNIVLNMLKAENKSYLKKTLEDVALVLLSLTVNKLSATISRFNVLFKTMNMHIPALTG